MYKLVIKNKTTKKVKDTLNLFDKTVEIDALENLKDKPNLASELVSIYAIVDNYCTDSLKKGNTIQLKTKDGKSLGESLESILNASYYPLQSAKMLKWFKTSGFFNFKDTKNIELKPHYAIALEEVRK